MVTSTWFRCLLCVVCQIAIFAVGPAFSVDLTALRDTYTKQYAEVQNSSLPPTEKSAKLGQLTQPSNPYHLLRPRPRMTSTAPRSLGRAGSLAPTAPFVTPTPARPR